MSGRNWGLKQSHPYEDDAVRSCTMAETQSDFSCHRVSLCYFKPFFFFFFGTRLAFRGLQFIGRDSLKTMFGTHPPPPDLKELLQLVSSGVFVMMGEDVLRGSLTTGGLSQQMSSKGEIGGILRDYVR